MIDWPAITVMEGRKNGFYAALRFWHITLEKSVGDQPAAGAATFSAEGAQCRLERRHKVCTGMTEPFDIEKRFPGIFYGPMGSFPLSH